MGISKKDAELLRKIFGDNKTAKSNFVPISIIFGDLVLKLAKQFPYKDNGKDIYFCIVSLLCSFLDTINENDDEMRILLDNIFEYYKENKKRNK